MLLDLVPIGSKLRLIIKPAVCKDQGLNSLKANVIKDPFLLSQVYMYQVLVRKLQISTSKKNWKILVFFLVLWGSGLCTSTRNNYQILRQCSLKQLLLFLWLNKGLSSRRHGVLTVGDLRKRWAKQTFSNISFKNFLQQWCWKGSCKVLRLRCHPFHVSALVGGHTGFLLTQSFFQTSRGVDFLCLHFLLWCQLADWFLSHF